jgi:hypothetical protein
MVFPSLAATDGSTLVCKPGDSVTLDCDPGIDTLKAATEQPAPAPVEAPQTPSEAPTSDAPAA